MKKWIKSFFAVDNNVNENTVIGTILVVVLIIATFFVKVPEDKYYVLAGLVASFFCIGAFKK